MRLQNIQRSGATTSRNPTEQNVMRLLRRPSDHRYNLNAITRPARAGGPGKESAPFQPASAFDSVVQYASHTEFVTPSILHMSLEDVWSVWAVFQVRCKVAITVQTAAKWFQSLSIWTS